MRRARALLMLAAVFLPLAGCQATPDAPVVIGKGDGQLEEKIAAQTDAPLPSDLPESGTRILETYKHDSLPITIKVDALVDTQDGKTMPAVKVTPHRFTQAEADSIYDRFVGDAHFFRIPEDKEWDVLDGVNIKNLEMEMEYAKADGGYNGKQLQRLEEKLEEARQAYLTAAEASDLPETPHTLRGGNLVSGEMTEGFFGYFEKAGMAYRLVIANDESGMLSDMTLQRCSEYDRDVMYDDMLGIGADIVYLDEGKSLRELSYGDALAVAEDTVSALGAEGMGVAYAEAKQYPEDTLESYYTFIFTHEVSGVPCIYNAVAIANDQGFSEIWNYEQMIVEIDAHGVKLAHWCYPCDVTEQLSESAAMISFDEVMNCFAKMVFIKNSFFNGQQEHAVTVKDDTAFVDGGDVSGVETTGEIYTVDSVAVTINSITLGLMRVQSGNEYLLIPVWDFYGYQQLLTADGKDIGQLSQGNKGEYEPSEQCLLTINAIDGSVIDLEQGY